MSVPFAKRAEDADCKLCLKMAASGELERRRMQRETKKQPGANNSGTPRYTEQQKAFASHPLVMTNPRKAGLDAGYSPSYVKSHIHALREQLSPLIMDMQEAARKRSAISKSRVQLELAAMGFANILDYFYVNEETGAMRPKQLNELSREQAAAIQEIKVIEFEGKMVVGHLKLADKRANLVELGKTLGMFNKITIEDKREDTVALQDVPTEALEQAESLLMAAVSQAKNQRAKNDAVDGEFKELPSPGAVEQENP